MKVMARILAYFSIVALLSGCGLSSNQIVKTQLFGAATANLGKLVEEEFVSIRRGIIEMNKELFSIDSTKKSKGLLFDKPAFAEPTSKRVAASRALKLYGELLVKLTTEGRSQNLQEAANALVDNTIAALEKDLPAEKRGAINKIIVGFGSFWVEKKKADSAKEIILAYQQPVDALADLLSKDFSLEGEGYLEAYMNRAQDLKTASMNMVNKSDKYTVLERAHAVHAFALAEMAIIRSCELSKKANKSIDGLKKANAELVKVIGEQQYSTDDIKSYAKQIQELVNLHQVLAN